MADHVHRAAVIGLGFIGAGDEVRAEEIGQRVVDLRGSVHSDVLDAHPRTMLVAGASRNAGRRARFRGRFPAARAYADYRELLAAERPEIVSVAANTPAHADITVACAEAGVRCVFCEKPLATSLADADRMLAACATHGVWLVVNHNRRWHPTYQAARRALADRAIGDLVCLYAHWPSGRLGNVGTHLFDALHSVLGQRIVAVSGTLDRTGRPDCRGSQYHDPGGWGMVRLAGGAHGFVEASEILPAQIGFGLRFVGSTGEMALSDRGCVITPYGGEATQVAGPADDVVTMKLAVDEIVSALDGGPPVTSTGEDGLVALEVIIGFHASDRRQGQWVELPLTGEDRRIAVQIG